MIIINNFAIVKLLEGFYAIEDLSRVGDHVLGFEKSYRSAISKVIHYLNRCCR